MLRHSRNCIYIYNTDRFVSYKDLKAFTADLKKIYKAATEEQAAAALSELDDKWSKKYPMSVKSWKNNWGELSTYFKYPEELRRIIYTTNTAENYHRCLRKVTKSKASFPSDMALLKLLYLITVEITKKWTEHMREWSIIYSQLYIHFGERIAPYVV